MAVPTLHSTRVKDESFAGVTYHLEGELVPVLHVELQQVPLYFEHHVLLWKHPQVEIGVRAMKGAIKRLFAGLPIFLTETRGTGHIAFSRDGAGQVVPLHLTHGQSIDVREHQFLAATGNVDYSFQSVQGVSNMLFGGSGFFIDTFTAAGADGIVWLHGYGNVFFVDLGPGEQIDIEPGGWVYKDRSVTMETQFQRLAAGFLASAGQVFWNRFTGPGRVGIQSMYYHPPVKSESSNTATTATGAGIVGGLLGAMLGGDRQGS
jgi:uncharacterized protein (AIM24 family)